MTCAKIAENGFKCPNHGKCKNKSPAGLAYFALDMKDIRKRLESCKTVDSPVDNIAIAREFIEDYMYNIDTGMVEAFVNYEIKAKFGFKTPELRRFVTFHKEIYKVFYFTPQNIKERVGGSELPAWYEVTDKGALRFMPGVLADHCAEHAPVFYCGEEYYFYGDGVYSPGNDLRAENFIRTHMIDRHKTSNQISDSEHQWRMQIDKDVTEINVNPYLMNFKNGLYNILTDEFLPHDSKVLSTVRLGGNYNPTAECPVFIRYINDTLPESEIPLIQEILGYMLIALNKAQKAFVLLGKAESGKSTLLYVVQDLLLQKINCSNLEWQKLDEKFATVQIFGRLANIFADLPNEQIRNTAMFKAIVGEDYISAQHKYKAYFSFKPFCRMLFSCEEMPKNYNDRSGGFYRRLIIVTFNNVIDPAKKDTDLRAKLIREADGILAWSLIGLKRLMANKFIFSETNRTKAALQEYKADNSTALTFVYENCVIETGAEVGRQNLYNAYSEYCANNGIKFKSSLTRFNKELDGLPTLTRATTAGIRTWRGIRMQ